MKNLIPLWRRCLGASTASPLAIPSPRIALLLAMVLVPITGRSGFGPLPEGEKPTVTHEAFAAGDCSLCHKKDDVKDPGPVSENVNELCFTCHDGIKKAVARKHPHPAIELGCVTCHNPHNAKQPKLLLEPQEKLCFGCHDSIEKLVEQSKLQHGALVTGARCANCHNPHGANLEHLLIESPMQLCLTCHGKDDVVDHDGKKLVNMKKLLAENPEQHAPVAGEECTICHNPHGAKHFGLLNQEYPAHFYSAYDRQLYGLCFECHDPELAEKAQTKSTGFRDGTRNLHYVHVNKPARGRTCRACHDVHAAPQKHQIRAVVPYGPNSWPLKLHYEATPTGGSCAKTCHATRSYDREAGAPAKTE